MRREGFELGIGRPQVIVKTVNGVKHEPFEMLYVDVQDGHESWVMEQMGIRGGELRNMEHGGGRVRMEFGIRYIYFLPFVLLFLIFFFFT